MNTISLPELGETHDAVSLLNEASSLEFPSTGAEGKRLTSIGFAFRTSAVSGTLLHKPALYSGQADYSIVLTAGIGIYIIWVYRNTIRVKISV